MDGARAEAGPRTRLVGVIGSPVAHSLSPLLHDAAFAALGLGDTWRSLAFEVAPGQAAGALAAMRRADISGLSVTMPHKAEVAALVDDCTEVARRLDAVNCIVNTDGVLLGANTDGAGFVASLARGAAFTPAGKRCLVIGAGGAARAVVLALADAGASEVAVLNRTPDRATAAAALAGAVGSVVTGSGDANHLAEVVASADLVVNATPVGMTGGAAAPGRGSWHPNCSMPARWPPTWSTSHGRRPGWSRRLPPAPAASMGWGCSCTRPPRNWACGPARCHRSRPCGRRPRRPITPGAESAEPAALGSRSRGGRGARRRPATTRPAPAPPASPPAGRGSAHRAVTGW